MVTDSLRNRIAAVQAKHLLVRYDRRAWWCQCGDDCLSVEGSHSFHVADAVIEALRLHRNDEEDEYGGYKPTGRYRYVTEWQADDE